MTAPNIESVASAVISARGQSETVRFESLRLDYADAPRAADLRNWQCFEGMILALTVSAARQHSVLGSAVMVGPGIALSASHIVKEFLPKIRSGELSLAAFGIRSDGAQIWKVRFVLSIERTDICILSLEYLSELPANRTFDQAMITTRLPAIGERVVVGGFQAAREEFQQPTPSTLELEGRMRLTSGSVRKSYPQGRDAKLVPWPSLEVDGPLFGGMSGGPVFDARGGLIGLGSRSFDMGVDEEPSPMVVALLWPVLGKPFPLADAPDRTASLLDLHGKCLIIERPEAVTVEKTELPDGHLTTYTEWT